MKFLIISLLIIGAIYGCKPKSPGRIIDEFELGKEFNAENARNKFGENTLNRTYKRLKSLGIDPRVDVQNDVWDYTFENGKPGFIHFIVRDKVLTAIFLSVGSVYQPYPDRPGLDDYYRVKDEYSEEMVAVLKTALRNKYGKESDSTVSIPVGDAKILTWRLSDYNIVLSYNDIQRNELSVSYQLDYDSEKKLEDEHEKRTLEKQRDAF